MEVMIWWYERNYITRIRRLIMNIGLIGAGAIAHFLLQEIKGKQQDGLRINSIFVRDKKKYQTLASDFGVELFTDLDAFLNSEIDIVVEAADINAVKALAPTIVKTKAVVLISVGALANMELLEELSQLAHQHKNEIHLPSGAVGGLDILQNAQALGKVSTVFLTTRKPASSLIAEDVAEAKVVFEGTAAEAIERFPKNMNVSIVLALAGMGLEKTTVALIADPHIDKNIHSVEIIGEFGEATITIKNNPLPENPKTSYLAAMSIIGTLKRIGRKLRIG